MKHFYRILFTAAILLVSLMIFNDQNNEDPGRISENSDIEHLELRAAFSLTRIARSSVSSFWRNSEIRIIPLLNNINDPAYLIRLKTQMQVHLELLPELDHHSGLHLQHYSTIEDPLIT